MADITYEVPKANADNIHSAIDYFGTLIYNNSLIHGFWGTGLPQRNSGESIALMHSELSEALEAIRKNPDQKSEAIPEHYNVTEELADCIIRILDYAIGNQLDIAGALIAKHNYNCARPYKHGKKF